MRYIFILLTIIAVSCNPATSPINQEEADSSSDIAVNRDTGSSKKTSSFPADNIDIIRKEYSRINSLAPDSLGYSFECDEKTNVLVYKDGSSIVKVVIDWGWVGDATTKDEHYYKDGKLFFSYKRIEGGVGDQPNKVFETRTYVKDDKVIRFMEDDKIEPCTKCSYNDTSKEYRVLKPSTDAQMKEALCR